MYRLRTYCMQHGNTPLILAVLHDNLAALDLLLSHGADVNAKHVKEGFSALYIAAREGQEGVVNRLIEGGADVNIVHEVGTCMHVYVFWLSAI
jgi:ankyrin repeat protein